MCCGVTATRPNELAGSGGNFFLYLTDSCFISIHSKDDPCEVNWNAKGRWPIVLFMTPERERRLPVIIDSWLEIFSVTAMDFTLRGPQGDAVAPRWSHLTFSKTQLGRRPRCVSGFVTLFIAADACDGHYWVWSGSGGVMENRLSFAWQPHS